MGVHEDIKAIALGESQDGDGVLNPLLIILARPCMLNSFPRPDIAYEIITPSFKSCEVGMCLVDGEGSADERYIVPVVKVLWVIGRKIRSCGELCVASNVDST